MSVNFSVSKANDFEGTLILPTLATGNPSPHEITDEVGDIANIGNNFHLSIGKKEKLSNEILRRAGGLFVKWLNKHQLENCGVTLTPILSTGISPMAAVTAFVEGIVLGNFKFDKYLQTKTKTELKITLLLDEKVSLSMDEIKDAVFRAVTIAEATNLARELSHEPPNVINPQTLSEKVEKIAAAAGLKFSVITDKELEAMGAGAITAVGKGSNTPSRLIILEHNTTSSEKPVVLIGKSLTMDTGGYSLKGTENIVTMKYDKTGGMVVVGAMVAAAKLGIASPVIGVLAAAENMISSKAYRPDDILTALNGKTIEIISTDAEGRLVLADALTYSERKFTPKAMIDIATLTGAVAVALGDKRAGLLSNDDTLATALFESGERTFERLWRLPLDEDYFEQIKGTDSDIKNSGGKKAGTIIGGKFLQQFVTGETPWAHLDIAGMMMAEKDMPYCPKGGMGFGVRLLVDYLTNL